MDSLLGGGSYGVVVRVYKAGCYYAMKVYFDEYLTRKGQGICLAALLFQRETEILRSIRHPQIPAYIDSFEYKNMYCLVQEYVPGNTFAELMNQGYQSSEEMVKDIVFKLLKLLSFLHGPMDTRPTIIHRDLRLSNLILSDKGLFLIDFGLAYRMQNSTDEALLAKCRLLKNASSSYVSMRNDLTVQSDLFGVGVVAVDLFINSVISDVSTQWEEVVPISLPFKTFIRKLLGVESCFASCTEAIDQLRLL
ncbi:MAG: Serine/threonine-protein kinaselike domain protein [Firmicutes bacterium]|nr:Serine/threonine-protein kinaselike domain protein [Bacillota bacterium]